jgi:hypothetical protein
MLHSMATENISLFQVSFDVPSSEVTSRIENLLLDYIAPLFDSEKKHPGPPTFQIVKILMFLLFFLTLKQLKRKTKNSFFYFDSLKQESSMRLMENYTESKLSLSSLQYHCNCKLPFKDSINKVKCGNWHLLSI